VSATRVRFETHDGGVWVARSAHPQIDMVKPIVVGSNVFLGYGAIVMPGVTIGDNVVIGAGAVVTRDIPANSVAVGSRRASSAQPAPISPMP
jgi:acetyltransferase-like isoleucine patch superfamily enzyme